MPFDVRYLNNVAGDPDTAYSIVKLESPTNRFFIGRVPTLAPLYVSGDGESIPWAEDSQQVAIRSLLFRRGASSSADGFPAFYLFQDRNGDVCWSPFGSGNPDYGSRIVTIREVGVDVTIRPAALLVTPTLAAV